MKRAALLFALAASLFADGGSVLIHQQSGSFLITVFGAPQVGTTDFSVLVQNASDLSPILDAGVQLSLGDITVLATHDQATNKLLYAALIKVTHPGLNTLSVKITRGSLSTTLDSDIDVAPASGPWLAYWPYFAIVPATILLFALNHRLKARRVRRRSN